VTCRRPRWWSATAYRPGYDCPRVTLAQRVASLLDAEPRVVSTEIEPTRDDTVSRAGLYLPDTAVLIKVHDPPTGWARVHGLHAGSSRARRPAGTTGAQHPGWSEGGSCGFKIESSRAFRIRRKPAHAGGLRPRRGFRSEDLEMTAARHPTEGSTPAGQGGSRWSAT